MDTSTLRKILAEEVREYAGLGANSVALAVFDDSRDYYAVVAIDYPKRVEMGDVFLLARLEGDKIVIEEDMTDKKLIDALLQRGVPREQIILAYKEPAPEIQVETWMPQL